MYIIFPTLADVAFSNLTAPSSVNVRETPNADELLLDDVSVYACALLTSEPVRSGS